MTKFPINICVIQYFNFAIKFIEKLYQLFPAALSRLLNKKFPIGRSSLKTRTPGLSGQSLEIRSTFVNLHRPVRRLHSEASPGFFSGGGNAPAT